MKIPLIFLDMDEVLVDFEAGAARLHGAKMALVAARTEWDMCKALGVTPEEFWQPIHDAGEDFWYELEDLPWADEVMGLCKQYADEVIIVSSPSCCVTSHIGKIEWLREKYGEGFRDFLLFQRKELLAQQGRLLVDDRLSNCQSFMVGKNGSPTGGQAILFPAYGNELKGLRGDMRYFQHLLERNVDEARKEERLIG